MATRKLDPFTSEVIRSALVAVGDEMFIAMQRTAMSPIIYEVLDYAVGITDRHGRLVIQGNGVPLFIGTLDTSVQSIINKFGDDIHPGDIFIGNDPYGGGGTHLSDVSLIMPIFVDEEIFCFVCNKAHWSEVGGKDPGSWSTNATEIYQEGLQFPNLRLFDRSSINQSLVDLIAANVRLPDSSLGDMWAGIAALRVGERRIQELVVKHEAQVISQAMGEFLDYSENIILAELARLPRGIYEATDLIDDDGIGNGPFPVQVKITITENHFTADFTGSHPQVLGPINNTYTGLLSGARGAFLAVTSPDVPVNEGCFRSLSVICPEGTLFTAKRPAPVSIYWETLLYATDLIWKALAPHMPARLPAGHLLSTCGTNVASYHPDTGEATMLVHPLVGGWGALASRDGESGQFCAGDGETFNIPTEVLENAHALRVVQYGFHNEDGGHGKFRGGKGVALEYEVLIDDTYVTAAYGRTSIRPWAVNGGTEGSNNYIEVHRNSETIEKSGKVSRVKLKKGDRIRMVTATGGGYGNPVERQPDLIEKDLKNGYLTVEQARSVYRYHGGLPIPCI